MASRKLRFAIFGNTYQPKKSVSIQKILASLSEYKADVYMEREFYDFLQNGQQLRIEVTRVFEGNDFDADFVISMGGDGTFLRAASMVGSKEIPILGINTGRLGFLADVNAHEIERIISALYEGDFTLETRSVILVETDGQLLQGSEYLSGRWSCDLYSDRFHGLFIICRRTYHRARYKGVFYDGCCSSLTECTPDSSSRQFRDRTWRGEP